jgi:hypothetical protein
MDASMTTGFYGKKSEPTKNADLAGSIRLRLPASAVLVGD